jgi:hypothetical protein
VVTPNDPVQARAVSGASLWNRGLSRVPPPVGLLKHHGRGVCYGLGRRTVVISEPSAVLSGSRRTDAVSSIRMEIVRSDFPGSNRRAPSCRDAFGSAPSDLDHETATPLIELYGKKVDMLFADPSKMWERSLETARA